MTAPGSGASSGSDLSPRTLFNRDRRKFGKKRNELVALSVVLRLAGVRGCVPREVWMCFCPGDRSILSGPFFWRVAGQELPRGLGSFLRFSFVQLSYWLFSGS